MVKDKVNDNITVNFKDQALADYFKANEDLYEELLDNCEEIRISYPSGSVEIFLDYDGDVEEWYVDHYSEKH